MQRTCAHAPCGSTRSQPRAQAILFYWRSSGPKNNKSPSLSAGAFDITGQLPTLPHTCACSTIGAEGLNFRVRDGNGWVPLATVTQNWLHRAATYWRGHRENPKSLNIDGTYHLQNSPCVESKFY